MMILYLKTDIHFKPLLAGGSITHMIGILKGFIKQGHTVVVATSVDHEDLDALELAHKTILKLPRIVTLMRWKISCLLSSIIFLYTTFKLAGKYNPDYIYQRYSPFNFTGVLLQKITKVPLIIEYNGSEVWAQQAWFTCTKPQQLLRGCMAWCEKKILQSAGHITTVSEVLKNELQQYAIGTHRIVVTPNGVDTTMFSPHTIPIKITNASITPRLLIGTISTFRQWHGIEIVVELIKIIAQRNLDFHVLLIGDGPLAEWAITHLRDVSSDYYTLTGLIAPAKVPSYLAACDVFICPTLPNNDGSPFFGSPTKLFEYMSLAKPLIVSDIAQINSLLPDLLQVDAPTQTTSAITTHGGFCMQDKSC